MKLYGNASFSILLVLIGGLLQGCANIGGAGHCRFEDDAPEIAILRQQACEGDKVAAFNLGLMFEQGLGVAQDYQLARRYYSQAAVSTPEFTYIYVPGAGKVQGYVMPVQTGAGSPGLPQALYRLGRMYLEGLGGKEKSEKGLKMIRQAAAQGYGEAKRFLETQ